MVNLDSNAQSPSHTVSDASSIVFSICPSNDSDGELGAVSDASSTHYSTCPSNDSDGEIGAVLTIQTELESKNGKELRRLAREDFALKRKGGSCWMLGKLTPAWLDIKARIIHLKHMELRRQLECLDGKSDEGFLVGLLDSYELRPDGGFSTSLDLQQLKRIAVSMNVATKMTYSLSNHLSFPISLSLKLSWAIIELSLQVTDHEEEVFSDADDDEMPEIRIYDKSSEGIFELGSYDDVGFLLISNNLTRWREVSETVALADRKAGLKLCRKKCAVLLLP
ncbi:hypothetical protein Tco_1538632 [Tanacetum coccineum]